MKRPRIGSVFRGQSVSIRPAFAILRVVSSIPDDLQIILYSSSGSELTTARAALSLQARGVTRVWILRGGLKSWRELGLQVSTQVIEVVDLAARYGIRIADLTGHPTLSHETTRTPAQRPQAVSTRRA